MARISRLGVPGYPHLVVNFARLQEEKNRSVGKHGLLRLAAVAKLRFSLGRPFRVASRKTTRI